MAYFDKKFIYSGMASCFTSLLFFALSSFFDRLTTPSTATLIGAIISTFTNFIFQFRILHPPHGNFSYAMLYKYPIGHIIDVSVTYLGCKFFFDRREKFIKYLPRKLRPYFNTIVRVIVMMFHWLFVAYPIRRYWIFT